MHQVYEPMQRILVVEPQGNCLQAIKSLETQIVAKTSSCTKTSAYIIVLSDFSQVIESSKPWVVAERPWGIKALGHYYSYYRGVLDIEVSSCFLIRLFPRGYTTLVIGLLSKYIWLVSMSMSVYP